MTSVVHHHSSLSSLGGQMADCNAESHVGLPELDSLHHHVHQPMLTPPPQMPPPPVSSYSVSDSNSHCLRLLDKLRNQREQARFADLIISVQGREFPAHRCVLAACSTWFDSNLKVHKCIREYIVIEECKDYEVFYALLTYCYTGHINLNDSNVSELLHLSNYYGMMKLRTKCCAYLEQTLNIKRVRSVLDQAMKYQIPELKKQSLAFLHRHFTYIVQHHRQEIVNFPFSIIQMFLIEKGWSLPQEYVLKVIADWVAADIANREDLFIQLLDLVNWQALNNNFFCDHINSEPLYNNGTALFTILHYYLGRSTNGLDPKLQEIYQNLQSTQQDLAELNDNNSFLTLAINSAVKTLEHSDVDTDWFLQGEGNDQILTTSATSVNIPQASNVPQRHERIERYKDSFDLDIFDQVINEHPTIVEERPKPIPTSTLSAKRVNPKFRALSEAFRQAEEESVMPPPAPASPKFVEPVYPPHPKQRHLSNTVAYNMASTSTSQRAEPVLREECLPQGYLTEAQSRGENLSSDYMTSSQRRLKTDNLHGEYLSTSQVQISSQDQDVTFDTSLVDYEGIDTHDLIVEDVATDSGLVEADSDEKLFVGRHFESNLLIEANPGNELGSLEEEAVLRTEPPSLEPIPEQVYTVEGKKQKASKLQRMSSLQDEAKPYDTSTQNRHVKKAKLLAEHRNSEASLDDVCLDSLQKKKFNCEKCSFTTRLKGRFDVHLKRHDKATSQQSSCPFCDFETSLNVELRRHVKKNHRGTPFQCRVCLYSAKKLQSLIVHMQVHSKEAKFKCDECNFTSNTVHKLKFHMKSRHSDQKFICKFCEKSFSTKQSLQTHELVHTAEKSNFFSCEDCDFTTKYSNHFVLHRKIHRGEVLKCSVCDYSTPKPSHLRNHELTHKGEKPFKCSVCQRGFAEKSQMTRHMRVHSDAMPFACEKCQFKTKRKDKLKNHLEKVHKEVHQPHQ